MSHVADKVREIVFQLAQVHHAMTRESWREGLTETVAEEQLSDVMLRLALLCTPDELLATTLVSEAVRAARGEDAPARAAKPRHLVLTQHDDELVRVLVAPSGGETEVLYWMQIRDHGRARMHFVAPAQVQIKRERLDRQIPGINGTPTRAGGAIS